MIDVNDAIHLSLTLHVCISVSVAVSVPGPEEVGNLGTDLAET